MAAWDELVLACNLKKDISQEVIDVLRYMVKPLEDIEEQAVNSVSLPEHPFFKNNSEWIFFYMGILLIFMANVSQNFR